MSKWKSKQRRSIPNNGVVQLRFLLRLTRSQNEPYMYTSFLVSIFCCLVVSCYYFFSYLNSDLFIQVCYFGWRGLRTSYACMYCWLVFFCHFFQFPTPQQWRFHLCLLLFVWCVLQNAPYIHTRMYHLPFSSNVFFPFLCVNIIGLP